MSELHCPARILICCDPASSVVGEAFTQERLARTLRGQFAVPVADAVDEPRLDTPSGVCTVLDELVDQFRGECVALFVTPQVLTAVRDLAGVTHDRQVRVLD